MNQRSTYLYQIIEKIGAPLLASIAAVSAANPLNSGDADSATQDAQKMAELLGSAVKLSIELGQTTGLSSAPPEQIESLRVALAGLAGPIVAEQYRQSNKVPAENDIKRVTAALEAVMTFSENFTPGEDGAKRLATVEANGIPVDGYQTNVQIIQAFVPVISAIAAFPFGQQEKKFIQEVSSRLLKKAQEIRENFFAGETNIDDQKTIELGIIKGLAHIYTDCHLAEMNRMMKAEGAGDNEQTGLDKVWADFDIRADMLESLGTNMLSSTNPSSSSTGPAAPIPPAAPDIVPETPVTAQPIEETAPTTTPEPSETPPPPAPEQAPAQESSTQAPTQAENTADSGGGSPMGFFSKKPNESAAPAAEQSAATAPSQQTTETPPPQTPATAPSAAPNQPAGDNGGSPMSFFGAKPAASESATPSPPAAAPTESTPQQPPTQTPAPAQPPAENTSSTDTQKEDNTSQAGDPMAFFKKPTDSEE